MKNVVKITEIFIMLVFGIFLLIGCADINIGIDKENDVEDEDAKISIIIYENDRSKLYEKRIS